MQRAGRSRVWKARTVSLAGQEKAFPSQKIWWNADQMELCLFLPTGRLIRSKHVGIIIKKKKTKHKNTKNTQTTRSTGKMKSGGWFLYLLRGNGLWTLDKRAPGPSRAASAAIFKYFRVSIHTSVACAVCLYQRVLLKWWRLKRRAMFLVESTRT